MPQTEPNETDRATHLRSTLGRRRSDSRKRRVLIINCYFPEVRRAIRLPKEIPNALAPILLAGAFSERHFEIRLYNEISHGFLEVFEPGLIDWPDMVVFTGLTTTFDRMLQLSAYLRTRNRAVMLVAGGLAIRALPEYARRFFDYACTGDVEEICEVIREVYGDEYVADERRPRYDLAHWLGRTFGYAESSRGCNFKCSFCSVTAHGQRYQKRSLDELRAQILAMGKRRILFFNDNQFHAHDQDFYEARVELLSELRAAGHFRHWTAFVTDSFFWRDRNLELARESGCIMLFVGVESFDDEWLARVNKSQNSRYSQAELIAKCQDAGILFQYGLVFDPSDRTLAGMHRELDAICRDPRIPLPTFIFNAFPVPGTPFFADRAERGLILPNTKVRDLEGSTLCTVPRTDSVEEVADFLRTAKNLQGYVGRALRHQLEHLWRYREPLSGLQALISTGTMATILAPRVASNPALVFARRSPRTHVSSTDILDPVYRPRLPVASDLEHYFQPTMVTDHAGHLNEALAADLLARRYTGTAAGSASGVRQPDLPRRRALVS